jgi:asparagine synthase (glutamine-hydrolysing)
MCGIAGIVNLDAARPVDREVLRRMTDAVSHRGPDGEGYFVDGPIGLGHKRLSIIDLSTGDQPMSSADRKLVVVFNGEIYNYVELRSELQSLGHVFETTSDTEVILKAYEQWGLDCQSRFNGMWAFALWDARQALLLVSRDRLGEKPLHYSLADGSLVFGSEIKCVLASGRRCPPDLSLLQVYLSLGYVPAPFTFYRGVEKLLPGHCLVVRNGSVQRQCYWRLPDITESDMRTDAEAIYGSFADCFSDAVRIRMRSDVPYGAFLSGGLDSSSVVAAMSRVMHAPVQTFTIGFADGAFDERGLARVVAGHFKTAHHEGIAEPDTFDESLRGILRHFDEPFGDASAIPVGLVSRLARRQVTMVLTGDGGDEVLSGYTAYRAEKGVEELRRVPGVVRRGLRESAGVAAALSRGRLRYVANRLERFLNLADVPFERRLAAKFSLLDPASIVRLVRADVPQLSIDEFLEGVFERCRFTDPFYRLMYFHLSVSLPDDMLAKVDRMSMAHSLEARVPFLDHRLVELAYCVDRDVKLRGYKLKNVLREAFGSRLPDAILNAPKMPFSVPLREWFKQSDFDARLGELRHIGGGLETDRIADVVAANRSGTHDYGDFIWRLFVLKGWLDAVA